MDEKMKNKIEKGINSLKVMNKDWFYRFFDMLEKHEVDSVFVDKALELVLREDNRYAGSMGIVNIFIKNRDAQSNIDNFFDYLEKMAHNLGPTKYKEFLERTILNIEKDFENHKNDNHAMKTNVFYLFVRELVLENPQDVEIKFSEGKYSDTLKVKLNNISLGHIELEETLANRKLLMISDMRTLPGLEKMGLGSYMFCELCKKIADEKPDHALMAWNVMKGRDGEKAYSAWGGYPIYPNYGEDGYEIVEKGLTKEEYDAVPGSLCYYFSEPVVLQNSKKASKKYGLVSTNENKKDTTVTK